VEPGQTTPEAAAHAEAQRTDPPHFVGAIGTRHSDIDKLVRRLQSKAAQLVFAYEAGPFALATRGC